MSFTRKEQDTVDEFREEVYDKIQEVNPGETLDWRALFIGFAIGRGLAISRATNHEMCQKATEPADGPDYNC